MTATSASEQHAQTDDRPVASATRSAGGGIEMLTADLTTATWLRLSIASGSSAGGEHGDWVQPALVCGATTEPTVMETTIFSFETGIDGLTIANVENVSTMTQSTAFHTEGSHGLEVFSPVDGNWYGPLLDPPLDLSGKSLRKFDVKTADKGTSAEFALQVGPDFLWCQGGLWTWTNPGSSQHHRDSSRALHPKLERVAEARTCGRRLRDAAFAGATAIRHA